MLKTNGFWPVLRSKIVKIKMISSRVRSCELFLLRLKCATQVARLGSRSRSREKGLLKALLSAFSAFESFENLRNSSQNLLISIHFFFFWRLFSSFPFLCRGPKASGASRRDEPRPRSPEERFRPQVMSSREPRTRRCEKKFRKEVFQWSLFYEILMNIWTSYSFYLFFKVFFEVFLFTFFMFFTYPLWEEKRAAPRCESRGGAPWPCRSLWGSQAKTWREEGQGREAWASKALRLI